MNNILIFGNGFISKKIQDAIRCDVSTNRIDSIGDAQASVDVYRPKIIINCIGTTGRNNSDDCELEKEKTIISNSLVPIIMAEIAIRNKIKLIHISSGCLYNGTPELITEDKEPDFFDLFYSRSKIYSENALRPFLKNYNILILRIRIPLDNKPHPKNVLTKLINYKKVIAIPNSITYLPDFVDVLRYLIGIDARGIFNVVNKNGLLYPDLLNEYKKFVPDFEYSIVDINSLGIKRTNLVLSVDRLESTGMQVRNINDIIPECVREYVKCEN